MEPQDNMENTNMQSKSAADEAYEKAKETVGKGVATAAGAVDGFNEKMDKHDVANKAAQAISKTGESTRQVAGTAVKEAVQTKEHVKSQAKPSSNDSTY